MKKTKQENQVNWFTGFLTFEGEDKHELLESHFKQATFIKNYWFQTEKGEESGSLHWQYTIQIKDKQGKRKTALLPWWLTVVKEFGNRFNTFKECSKEGKGDATIKYCTKSDTRINGPWSNLMMNDGSHLKMIETSPFPWQQKILDMINAPGDDRSVVYVYDNTGNNGKSKLTSYLDFHNLALYMDVDNADRLKSAICDEGERKAYVIDIPRTLCCKSSLSSIYNVCEKIKDGMVNCYMFGKVKRCRPINAQVFIFSNALPELWRVSQDRWKVYEIVNKDLHKVEVSKFGKTIFKE